MGNRRSNLGLVDEVWSDEEFDTQFRDWVEELASCPKAALAETKALLREMRGYWTTNIGNERTVEAFERCYGTPEAEESVNRFMQRERKD